MSGVSERSDGLWAMIARKLLEEAEVLAVATGACRRESIEGFRRWRGTLEVRGVTSVARDIRRRIRGEQEPGLVALREFGVMP